MHRIRLGFIGFLGLAGVLIMAAGPVSAKDLAAAQTIEPDTGFVDDAYAFDGAGGRLAIVNTDAAKLCDVQIFDLHQGRRLARFSIAKATTEPAEIAFVLGGNRLFIKSSGKKRRAYVVDFKGRVLRRFGPATDINVAEVDGVPAAIIYQEKPGPRGGKIYQVSAQRLDNGRRIGKMKRLVADKNGFIKSINMALLYWRDHNAVLVGKKKGGYDEFKDRRMPDGEGHYAMLEGNVIRTREPQDVIEYTKVLELRKKRNNQSRFVAVSRDRTRLDRIAGDDKRTLIKLALPLHRYEPNSLRQENSADGTITFSLTIDPVNPDAVSRKKADRQFIDLYVLSPGSTKAKRVARVIKDKRPMSWRFSGNHWAILRKHKGFDRGGATLEIYKVTKP